MGCYYLFTLEWALHIYCRGLETVHHIRQHSVLHKNKSIACRRCTKSRYCRKPSIVGSIQISVSIKFNVMYEITRVQGGGRIKSYRILLEAACQGQKQAQHFTVNRLSGITQTHPRTWITMSWGVGFTEIDQLYQSSHQHLSKRANQHLFIRKSSHFRSKLYLLNTVLNEPEIMSH